MVATAVIQARQVMAATEAPAAAMVATAVIQVWQVAVDVRVQRVVLVRTAPMVEQ